MNASTKKLIQRALAAALVLLQPPLVAIAGDGATPLIDKLRNATAQYLEISNELADHFVPETPCVSGPDTEAMDVHFVRLDRVPKLVLDAQQPRMLIYEPMADGAMR